MAASEKVVCLKRSLALLFIFFTAFRVFGFVELEKRKALNVEDGRLTPFWAQEYIGADLAKESMRELTGTSRVPFAVYDLGFEKQFIHLSFDIPVDVAMNGRRPIRGNHGTSVANLINGSGMMSVSENVDYVQLKNVSPAIYYSTAVNELKEMENKPWIISNSMGWASETVLGLAKEVDQMGVIWVMAAGNEHPQKIVEYERLAPVISVGSYSPRGLQTLYSQESDQLDILAPADDYQASLDGFGKEVLFGATSGATPLVSGSIANAKALIPTLTRAEIETIMKKTAVKSLHSLYSKENKAGLFNAYKMFRVVKRLKDLCVRNSQCLQREIADPKNYTFVEIDLAPRTLTVCKGSERLSQDEMRRLRQNYFLNVKKTKYAKLLSCAYRNEGYSINADYYENIVFIYDDPAALQIKIQAQAAQAILNGYSVSGSFRDLQLLGPSFKDALLTVLKENKELQGLNARELLILYEATPKITLGSKQKKM